MIHELMDLDRFSFSFINKACTMIVVYFLKKVFLHDLPGLNDFLGDFLNHKRLLQKPHKSDSISSPRPHRLCTDFRHNFLVSTDL
jgi:hypothetical protein